VQEERSWTAILRKKSRHSIRILTYVFSQGKQGGLRDRGWVAEEWGGSEKMVI